MSIIIATKPNKTTCEVLGNPDPAKSVLQKHIYSSRPGLSRENKHAINYYIDIISHARCTVTIKG